MEQLALVDFQPLVQQQNREGQGQILIGDSLTVLETLPDKDFRCCVTSPPYWGLRDYGIPNQIGAESSLTEFIEKLVDVFREVRRVLIDDGTLWLNIGDCYTSGNRTWRATDKKNPARAMSYRSGFLLLPPR